MKKLNNHLSGINNKKLKKLETDILSEDSINALQGFAESLKTVNKTLRLMKRLNDIKENCSFSKTDLAKQLGISLKETDFSRIDHLAFNSVVFDYFTNELMKKDIAKVLFKPNYEFDGTQFRKPSWTMPSNININGEFVSLKHTSIEVNYNGLSFFLLCHYNPNGHANTNQSYGFWIVAAKDSLKACVNATEELYNKYSIFSSKMVEINSGGFNIIDTSSKFTFDDISLSDISRQEINLIVSMFKNHHKYKENNKPFKRGVLFYGDPGLGKSTISECLSQMVIDNGGTVFRITSLSSGQCNGMNLGQIYDAARLSRPCLILMEDFDIIAKDRNRFMPNNGTSQSDLLNLLENTKLYDGIITVATTNIVDQLDDAAIRSGRIDNRCFFDYPDKNQIINMVKLHYTYYEIESMSIDDVLDAFAATLGKKITGAAISSIMQSIKNMELSELEINKEIVSGMITNVTKHLKNNETAAVL